MAVTVNVTIENRRQIERAFERMERTIQRKVVRKALREVTSDLRDRLRAAAPVASGRLRRSIKSRVRVDRNVALGQVYTTADAFYWRFLEYGTEELPSRPFIRPELEGLEQDIVNQFRQTFAYWVSVYR